MLPIRSSFPIPPQFSGMTNGDTQRVEKVRSNGIEARLPPPHPPPHGS